ncbi:MAG: DoxX family protein [Xanthobacteraceae bacterium]|nr:DoxX family protein [Xanthobacteraceae bacterium]PWB63851.1 MAG: DoxX family protein [Bradyrhizobiaceae bacterium]
MSSHSIKTPDSLHVASRSPAVFSGLDGLVARNADGLLLVGRILMGWIFVTSGWSKLADLDGFAASLAHSGVPAASLLAYVGAPLEFVAGVALLLGLATRYATLFLILFMIVATLIAHRYWEFAEPAARRAQSNNFYKNVAMTGGLLAILVSGAGRFAIDRLMRRR